MDGSISLRNVTSHKVKISFLLLYVIIILLVAFRLYGIIVIDNLLIWGDVTNHYYPAGAAILEGGNPYDSIFINHPPYMLLLFALLVWIWDSPLTIGVFILMMYLLVPILSYRASLIYLSQGKSLLMAWLVTLNPATIYVGIILLDDDLIIMEMLLLLLIVYYRHPIAGALLSGTFGGFKYVPLFIGPVMSIIDNRYALRKRILCMVLCGAMFLLSVEVGFILWNTNALLRYQNYIRTVSVFSPAMSLFHVLSFYFDIGTNDSIRWTAILLSSLLLFLSFFNISRNRHRVSEMLPSVFALVIILTYIGNSTNNYTYYAWVPPMLLLLSFKRHTQNGSLRLAVLNLAILIMGYFIAEWANFTWLYGESMIIYAHIGSVYVSMLLLLFYVWINYDIAKSKDLRVVARGPENLP